MLVVGREAGQGLYIGRGVRFTIAEVQEGHASIRIEAPDSTIVSGPEVSSDDHIASQINSDGRVGADYSIVGHRFDLFRGQSIRIGRGISIAILEVQRDGIVRVGVSAPKVIAVTRDDFSFDRHMKWQRKREEAHT